MIKEDSQNVRLKVQGKTFHVWRVIALFAGKF